MKKRTFNFHSITQYIYMYVENQEYSVTSLSLFLIYRKLNVPYKYQCLERIKITKFYHKKKIISTFRTTNELNLSQSIKVLRTWSTVN